MLPERRTLLVQISLGLAAWIAVLLVYGAVPFLMLPTLGQAVWSMGFAESFAHGSWHEIYAKHFGLPQPAPMAFGLAGAWPASFLIRLGFHAADAYTAVVAGWLGIALVSAYRLGRAFDVKPGLAWLGATAWLTMPIVWAHADYSMLSLGIALLAFYLLAALRLFVSPQGIVSHPFRTSVFYVLACLVAVFMDGYTFVMFAVAATVLCFYAYWFRIQSRSLLTRLALPTHLLGFGFAYLLYGLYVGRTSFEAYPLDLFRGWSLDVLYLLIPTEGLQWLPDLLGYSHARADDVHFGDQSVWVTTYGLPVLMVGLLVVWQARHVKQGRHFGTMVLLMGLFSFYMALGPTLKLNSTKPVSLQQSHPQQLSAPMADHYGVAPTGNAWIYQYVPAFNVMRATYRWSALGLFAFWLMMMIWVGGRGQRMPWLAVSSIGFVILFNLPNMPQKWQEAVADRQMFLQIDTDLVAELRRAVGSGHTVAFVPWSNDFIINYVVPAADLRAFNIGGDKNLALAKDMWPKEFQQLSPSVTDQDAYGALKLLADRQVDVLVVPYFNSLWSAHFWYCPTSPRVTQTDRRVELYKQRRGFDCPDDYRHRYAPFVQALQAFPWIESKQSTWFTAFSLKPEFASVQQRQAILEKIAQEITYPISIAHDAPGLVFQSGWHEPEPNQVWSTSLAQLNLPVPENCDQIVCVARLTVHVFGASQARPVPVMLQTELSKTDWYFERVVSEPDTFTIDIPITGSQLSWQPVTISVPNATSPFELQTGFDVRVLGVSVQKIELLRL